MKRKNFKLGNSFYQQADWSEWDQYVFKTQISSLRLIAFQLHLKHELLMEDILIGVVRYLESFISKDEED